MILFHIALRNLWSHKVKTIIVGGLLTFGTVLVLIGQSLLASLDRSMAQSIVHSIAGHVQVSADGAKDKLALFGSPTDGTDIGNIKDFPRVRAVLEAMPEVKSVVPQGINQAIVFGGTVLDVKLEQLRAAEKAGDKARSQLLRDHVRRIVVLLGGELKNLGDMLDVKRLTPEFKQGIADIATAASDRFWTDFQADPLAGMEFLENKIAPMTLGDEMIFLRYIGTDTARFAKEFDRFEMVDGKPIPPGQRGFLFNKLTYEDHVKHKTARRLDKMKERRADGFEIASDDELTQWVKLNRTQYKEITYQLDAASADTVRKALQTELQSREVVLEKLLDAFLDMNDANFDRRFALFYDKVVPHLNLYHIRIGDTMTIKGLTESGYPTSVNVKIYGTFRFRSLDKSALAGAANLVDMMTFRDLYGFMTADKKEELAQLQKKSGVTELKRDDAEAALFGGEDASEDVAAVALAPAATAAVAVGAPGSAGAMDLAQAVTPGFDEFAKVDMREGAQRYGSEITNRVYTQAEIDGGIVRNAAIILRPGVDVGQAVARINEVSKRQGLGLKAIDWRTASGMVGNFIGVIYAVLATAILVIFLVALVIINNSMVMATMERVREIGTMRAIGAQRSEILKMFVVEALVLGAVFGLVGSVLGSGLVLWANLVGIPAASDVMVFLFAGPRLHPFLTPLHVAISMGVVFLVTLLSTLYPALLATRVTPLVAMQAAD